MENSKIARKVSMGGKKRFWRRQEKKEEDHRKLGNQGQYCQALRRN